MFFGLCISFLAPSHKSCGVFQVSLEGHWTYSWTDALVPQSLYVSLTWTAGILEICCSLRAKKMFHSTSGRWDFSFVLCLCGCCGVWLFCFGFCLLFGVVLVCFVLRIISLPPPSHKSCGVCMCSRRLFDLN